MKSYKERFRDIMNTDKAYVLRRRCGHPGTGEPVVGGLVYASTPNGNGMCVVCSSDGTTVTVRDHDKDGRELEWSLSIWSGHNDKIPHTWSFPSLPQIKAYEQAHPDFEKARNFQQAAGHLGNGRPTPGGTIHVTTPDYTGTALVDRVDVFLGHAGKSESMVMVEISKPQEMRLSPLKADKYRWRFLNVTEVVMRDAFRTRLKDIREQYRDRYIGKATSYGGGSPVASEIAADMRAAEENMKVAMGMTVPNPNPVNFPDPPTLDQAEGRALEEIGAKVTDEPPNFPDQPAQMTGKDDSRKFKQLKMPMATIPEGTPITGFLSPPPPPPMNQGDQITISMGGRYNIPGVYSQYLKDEKAHEVWVEDVGHFFLRRDLFRAAVEADEATYMPKVATCDECKKRPVTRPTRNKCSVCWDGDSLKQRMQGNANDHHASTSEANKRAWSRKLIEEQTDMRRMSSINRIGNHRWNGRVRQ